MKSDPLLITGGICLIFASFSPWFGLLGILPGAAEFSVHSSISFYRYAIFFAGVIILANGIRGFSRFWAFSAVWTAMWIAIVELGSMLKSQKAVTEAANISIHWLTQLQMKYSQPSIGFYLACAGALFGFFGVTYGQAFLKSGASLYSRLAKTCLLILISLLILFYPNILVYQQLKTALSYEKESNHEKAKAAYQQSLTLPVLIEIPFISAEVYQRYGLYCYRQNEYEEAKMFLNKALAGDPASYPVLKALGLISFQEKESEKSAHYLERALAIVDNDPEILEPLARIYIDNQQWSSAIAVLETMSSINPADPVVHALLGKLYLEQELYDEARVHLEQALALDDTLTEAHVNLGFIMLHEKEWLTAFFHFKRATELGWQKSELPKKAVGAWDKYIAPLFD